MSEVTFLTLGVPMTHRLVSVVGTGRPHQRAACSCGQTATIRMGQALSWIEHHRREPELSPADLATKWGIR